MVKESREKNILPDSEEKARSVQGPLVTGLVACPFIASLSDAGFPGNGLHGRRRYLGKVPEACAWYPRQAQKPTNTCLQGSSKHGPWLHQWWPALTEERRLGEPVWDHWTAQAHHSSRCGKEEEMWGWESRNFSGAWYSYPILKPKFRTGLNINSEKQSWCK